jgi:pimeloyl-ACP methyl ester carboxylesterase
MSRKPGPDLPPAVDAERREIDGRAGRLSGYVAGDGAPLLLIHSINAAGSVYEVKPLFEHYRKTRRVYAFDLPGFGFSERSRREYTVGLYTDAVHVMLDQIHSETGTSRIDTLALSLSSEFLARAAVDRAETVRSLTFVTPTGFRRGSDKLRGGERSTREVPGLHRVLTVGLWREGLYGLLTKPSVIRYFLERTWGSKDIDESLWKYDVLTTRQPGASHAPYAFLSGRLFSADIREVYERIEQPVFMPHGTRGDFRDFSEAGWTASRANWTVQAFDTGALPFFEQPARFFAAYDAFLASQAP